MLVFKKITMRNFFSFGNAPQEVILEDDALTLILGQNNDAINDGAEGARNGVGKSAIIQGLVFGLYGKSVGNSIKIPNLVNKTNSKNCEVQIEFEKDSVQYRVHRGRSPTFFNFYKNNTLMEVDESRGEMKDTQEELTEVLGISQSLFENIIILNTSVTPFLSLSASKQRDTIEELLGITQLTEKALLLKDMYRETRKLADQEKIRIDTITQSNVKIELAIDSLEQQAILFDKNKNIAIENLKTSLSSFNDIDWVEMTTLAQEHAAIMEENKNITDLLNSLSTLQSKRDKFNQNVKLQQDKLHKEIEVLEKLNIKDELDLHEQINSWNELNILFNQVRQDRILYNSKVQNIEKQVKSSTVRLENERKLLVDLENSQCPMCKQDLEHTDNHKTLLDSTKANIIGIEDEISTYNSELEVLHSEVPELFDMPAKPVTFYSTLSGAELHEHKLQTLKSSLNAVNDNPYDADIEELEEKLSTKEYKEIPADEFVDLGSIGMLQFEKSSLEKSIKEKSESPNPYYPQIETLKDTSLQFVDYDVYNTLVDTAEHQDFLCKLLTNKDSFVRKRIIEQNIQFLNKRLEYYIEKSGCQHSVTFMNDLSVDISLLGQSYDYGQLSRGESTRVTISLSLAFRDTFESLYQAVNIMFVDEILDQGLDTIGCYDAWNTLREISELRNKNIFVVSHREELLAKASIFLKVVKESNFSTIEREESE